MNKEYITKIFNQIKNIRCKNNFNFNKYIVLENLIVIFYNICYYDNYMKKLFYKYHNITYQISYKKSHIKQYMRELVIKNE